MTYPMFNLHDPQFVRYLEQSKMATKEEVSRMVDATYSNVIRDIENWCRDKSGQSCESSDSKLSSVQTPPESIANVQSRPMPIEHENESIELNEPIAEGHFPQTLSAPIVNEQSNQNNLDVDKGEEECECDECVYGILISDDDDDDDSPDHDDDTVIDSDSVQLVEDNIEESSRPAKKSRLDTEQPHNVTQSEVIGESPRQLTVEVTQQNQVTNQNQKQIITLRLQCPHCSVEFPEHKLNQHIRTKHSIGPFRCLVKDCDQHFDNKYILSGHIKQTHKHTTQLHCYKCAKQYTSYQLLSVHNSKNHQLGTFRCSFPSCTFTGKYRIKVYSHYTHKHKPTLTCQHFGCHFETTVPTNLRVHERTHLGAKPYRCKWSQCDYASTTQAHTISHILRNHLTHDPNSVPNSAQIDPKDYVEVVHDLL